MLIHPSILLVPSHKLHVLFLSSFFCFCILSFENEVRSYHRSWFLTTRACTTIQITVCNVSTRKTVISSNYHSINISIREKLLFSLSLSLSLFLFIVESFCSLCSLLFSLLIQTSVDFFFIWIVSSLVFRVCSLCLCWMHTNCLMICLLNVVILVFCSHGRD